MPEQIPAISVLLPVYNGAQYLAESIDSILGQTWQDFELIIINDGSKDESQEIIQSYSDSRIRYFEHENIGLAATLNRGIGLAKGHFIARQDQDDVSAPDRFASQIGYLEANPRCGMVGTWAEIWCDRLKTERLLCHPLDNVVLQFHLVFDNPFVHSSVMLRREIFDVVGGYSTDCSRQPPEDYELWSRVARCCEVGNIPEILVVYREVPHSMSRNTNNAFTDRMILISAENLAWWLGLSAPNELCFTLAAFAQGGFGAVSGNRYEMRMIQSCLQILAERLSKVYSAPQEMLNGVARNYYRGIKYNYNRHRYGVLYARLCYLNDQLWSG